MRYDKEKLIDILSILAINKQELTKLRINKLLYFIDKLHLRKYGRFVLNDKYFRLKLGPIPSLTSDIINEFFGPEYSFLNKYKKKEKDYFKELFKAGKNKSGYDMLILERKHSFNALSRSEIEVIEDVLCEYGKYSTSRLVDISHYDATWRKTDEPNEIDEELFLDGLPEKEKKMILDLIEIDHENNCVTSFLNK